MSSIKSRISLTHAKAIAAEVIRLLAPACERIEIAGSIRRGRPHVGDIEIVAIPHLYHITQSDMFGEAIEIVEHSELDDVCESLLQQGRLTHRVSSSGARAWGTRYKRALYHPEAGSEPVPLDLFVVLPPAQWGVIYTLRTGPGDFSRLLVTSQLKGGALPIFYQVKDGALTFHGRAVETPEEADFFAALGLSVIPPGWRTVKRLRRVLRRRTPAS